MRLLSRLFAALLSIAFAGPALAGDAAALNVLGFSADGRWFAFEQYTMVYDDDASFSEFVVIDTSRDRFLAGTPIRVRMEGDDGLDEEKARQEAARRAAPLLRSHAIGERGRRIVGNPSMAVDEIGIYQMGAQPFDTSLDMRDVLGPDARLVLTETPLGTVSCPGAGGTGMDGPVEVHGLTLRLVRPGTADIVLQRDERLPRSRRCAMSYGIAEAWWLPDGPTGGTLAVIVEYSDADDYHAGPNRRFLAVTRRLSTGG